MTTTSGSVASTRSTASGPLAASPTTSKPVDAGEHAAHPVAHDGVVVDDQMRTGHAASRASAGRRAETAAPRPGLGLEG